jgi:hypothetical protein
MHREVYGDVDPTPGHVYPAAQSEHTEAALLLYVPLRQIDGFIVATEPQEYPAGHGVHDVAPTPL